MLLKIYPGNPDQHKISKAVACMRSGGVIIFPTDTVYAFGCDIYNSKAVEKICRLKNVKLEKANFSFICYDLSHISDFTMQVETSVYKLMKKVLPGPFTFILKANSSIPKLFKSGKKTIGIRVPDNNIARMLVKELGNPLMAASVHEDNAITEYPTDPEVIYNTFHKQVDLVIDGGAGDNRASTVLDCTGEEPMIIREGKGIALADSGDVYMLEN